jgi:hypothetical protein
MPIKVILMVKRKPGLSPEEFRLVYETDHSHLGLKLFGHLWLDCKRIYLQQAIGSMLSHAIPLDGQGQIDCPVDVITEIVFPNMGALRESIRIANIEENKRLLIDDAERIFDRPKCWVALADTNSDDPRVAHDLGADSSWTDPLFCSVWW